jgi:hypothetical protein
MKTEDDFFERYTTEFNPFFSNPDDCPWGGCMLETYGEEVDYAYDIYSIKPKKVWTIVETDGDEYVLAGWHLVNRLGYLITVEEWEDPYEEYRWEGVDDDNEDSEIV